METPQRQGDRDIRWAPPYAVQTFVGWAWALLTAAAVVWLLYTFTLRLLVVVVPIAVALLVTAILKPAVDWAERHRVNRTLSTVAVLLGGLSAAVAVGWIIVPRVANQLMELRTALSDALRSLEQWLSHERVEKRNGAPPYPFAGRRGYPRPGSARAGAGEH